MQFKEKENSCILFTAHIHPRRYKRLFQQVHQKKSESFLSFLLPLRLSLLFFYNRSSTIRQTQRKITNTAKLPSTELPTTLPQKSFLQNSVHFFPKLPLGITPPFFYAPKPPFHNCSADPDHNIGVAIQPPFNSSRPANFPTKTPHTDQMVIPMQM